MPNVPTPPAVRPHLDAGASMSAERVVPLVPVAGDTASAPAAHGLDAAVIDAVIDAALAPLPVGVLVADPEGRVAYANAAARRLRLDRLAPVRRALTFALRDGAPVREEALELRETTGSLGWFDLAATPVRGPDGAVAAAVLTLVDVTPARKLRDWDAFAESLVNL